MRNSAVPISEKSNVFHIHLSGMDGEKRAFTHNFVAAKNNGSISGALSYMSPGK